MLFPCGFPIGFTEMFRSELVAVGLDVNFKLLYFWLSGGDLRTGIGWDLIFITINLYQIYRLVKDRLSLRLPEADRELLRSVFTGLDDVQIARLLVAGEFCDLADGMALAEENQAARFPTGASRAKKRLIGCMSALGQRTRWRRTRTSALCHDPTSLPVPLTRPVLPTRRLAAVTNDPAHAIIV